MPPCALAQNDAIEELYEFLGDEEPIVTSSYDACIGEDGKTLVRVFMNGTEVQSGRLDVEFAKQLHAQSGTVVEKWEKAKEEWMIARKLANRHWYPPATLNCKRGIKTL